MSPGTKTSTRFSLKENRTSMSPAEDTLTVEPVKLWRFRSAGVLAGGSSVREPSRPPQQRRNLLIADLRKIPVELPNRIEILGRIEANQLVCLPAEPRAGGGGRHRNRHHHPGRLLLSQCPDCSQHACPGCDPVVHQDDRPARSEERRVGKEC